MNQSDKCFKQALKDIVEEIQNYPEDEMRQRLREREESPLTKTVNLINEQLTLHILIKPCTVFGKQKEV